jgi:large subunit ribosomal protein L10
MDVDTKAYAGGVVSIFGTGDEVAPAQIIATFAKTHDVMTIFGGILEGKYIDAIKVTELSKLPSKEQLYAQLVGTLNAPISGFVNVLAGNLRGLVQVLNAIKEQKA